MIRKAFTLIELTIVIVVMGILAMISADIISNLYERYLIDRTITQLETKTEFAADLIAKRLQYRIKKSMIARKNNTIVPLTSADASYPILEWIGYDDDGLKGGWSGSYNTPGWSGFADIDGYDATHQILRCPGSRFDLEDTILRQISYGSVDFSTAASKPAIVFKGAFPDLNVSKFGWNGSADHNYTLRISRLNNDTLHLDDRPLVISERFKIVWSAYALVPTGPDCNVTPPRTPQHCDLYLHYDFRPWENEKYDDANTKSTLLIENISSFRFRQTGNAIHIKLCTHAGAQEYGDLNISICKERIVE